MQPPPVSTIPAQKNGLATAGLICGILAPLTCSSTSIPAVILGHISLSKIKASGGSLAGQTASIWALILGYGTFLLIPILAVLAGLTAPLVLKKVEQGQIIACQSNVRLIGSSLLTYNMEHGTDTAPYPSDIRQLDSMGITSNITELLKIPGRDGKTPPGNWLYFSAADSENPSAPLLISPLIRSKHVVLYTDMSTATLNKSELTSVISAAPVAPEQIPETK